MKQYLELLADVWANGVERVDRTGVGTKGVFGRQMRMDLSEGFPILTTKKVHWKSVATELCWFLKGQTNVRYLQERGVTIWNEWADGEGELGPVYGKQWRDFAGVDQLANLVRDLRANPFSRRHVVTAWNPADVPRMKLPPCHTLWQCYVAEQAGFLPALSLHLYARSIDIFLGLPFNIASYALLVEMLARQVGMLPGELVISFGDLHIYKNHYEQVQEQLRRKPGKLPYLVCNRGREELWDYEPEDFELLGYEPQAAIKAPVAV